MFAVVIRQKGGETETREFDQDEVSIGRVQGNDIVLAKGNISKSHAQISTRDNGFVVSDLRSTNGTYVNGHRISSPHVIGSGDKIYIGDFILEVEGLEAEAVEEDPDATRALDVAEAGLAMTSEGPPQSVPQQPAPMETEAYQVESLEASPADSDSLDEGELELAQPVEVSEVEPAPVVEELAPAAEEPAPAGEESAPVVEESAPVVEESAPVVEESAPVVEESAPVVEEPDDPPEFERYLETLEMLHAQANQAVFAGRDLENIDFESQWQELENAVYSVVEAAHRNGDVPEFLDLGGLTTDILYEYTALGPIEYFLAEEAAREIHINAFNQIYVRRGEQLELEWKSFGSQASYEVVVGRLMNSSAAEGVEHSLAGSGVSRGQLDDGTMWQVVSSPLAPGGPLVTLLKPPRGAVTALALVEAGAMDDPIAEYLSQRVGREGASVAVVGRGRGECTSVLNALSLFVPGEARVALIEGQPGVSLVHENVVRLDGDQDDAIPAAQSLLVDCIVAVEPPSVQVPALLLNSTAGRESTLVSLYGRSAADFIARTRALLVSVCGVSQVDAVITSALEMLVVVAKHDSKMVISEVVELGLAEDGTLSQRRVFHHDADGDSGPFVRD